MQTTPKVTPIADHEVAETASVLDWLSRNARRLELDPDDWETRVGTLAVAVRAIDRANEIGIRAAGTFVSLMKTQATDLYGVRWGIPTDDQRERGKQRLYAWQDEHRTPWMTGVLKGIGAKE